MQMAEEPDMRELLQRALAAVLGVRAAVPLPARAGRRAAAEPTSAGATGRRAGCRAADDGRPATRAAMTEQGSPVGEPTSATSPTSELERLLTHDLGGQIIGEHAAPSADDGGAEDDAAIEARYGQRGPRARTAPDCSIPKRED